MFFFIGGITPKLKKLSEQPLVCPRCGRNSLFQVKIDHYLNLFFIPVARIKSSSPFYLCENCGWESPEPSGRFDSASFDQSQSPSGKNVCQFCGRLVDKDFYYCPYCGHPLK
ncbi:MAG: zinc ribbon domain-containing protein [Candidatus Aminicenantes bacterium]|nr:zinc ribbon domain-containing protein [Candidatus Aminicenantes bacterium]